MAQISTAKRIGYLLVLLVVVGGMVGSYVLTTYQVMNPNPEDEASRREINELQQRLTEYQAWQTKTAQKYSDKYYPEFKAYEKVNQAYNAESVKELKTADLKVGDGAEITAETPYQAYYIGWLPNGDVFDGSFDGGKLKMPLTGGNMIEGWNEGVLGMKMNGVRELTIPADLAYGESASGTIPANSPIKFVLMVIPPLTDEDVAGRPQL